jgi:DNA repair exonuclease SbcCD ATPase subunit
MTVGGVSGGGRFEPKPPSNEDLKALLASVQKQLNYALATAQANSDELNKANEQRSDPQPITPNLPWITVPQTSPHYITPVNPQPITPINPKQMQQEIDANMSELIAKIKQINPSLAQQLSQTYQSSISDPNSPQYAVIMQKLEEISKQLG